MAKADNHGKEEGKDEGGSMDLDILLDGLLLNTKIISHSNPQQDGLKYLLKEPNDSFDYTLPPHLQELHKIAARIDNRILNIHQAFDLDHCRIDYRAALNPQQLAAVCTTEKPLLVIAGAGTGKTRVITYKVSYLIEKGYDAHQLLLLTFTRKAASEMLGRVQQLLGKKADVHVLGGTFHAFANYALRKYHALIELSPNFSIIDSEDTVDIISLLKTELNLGAKKGGKHFPKSASIQNILSKSKNLERSIGDILTEYFPEYLKNQPDLEKLDQVLTAYKRRSSLLDYDDLILIFRNKLKDSKVFRNALQKQIAYTLVDEYQDTNTIQRDIVELLSKDTGKVTVVGDDIQSIYSFRGANFENILRFPESFDNAAVVKIEENYRSTEAILNFTNNIISSARIGFKKALFTHLQRGQKPIVKRLVSATEEAIYIVDSLMKLKENDLEYADFAILTRASWQSNFVQAELMKREIPFVVVGGIKFGERRHVKDMVSFLKILVNPMDAVAWHRVLKLLEGIGDIRAKEIIGVIHQQGGTIDPALFSDRKNFESLNQLFSLLKRVQEEEQVPANLIPPIYAFYQPLLQRLEDDFETRKIDLEIFAEIAGQYDSLEKFLTEFTLDPPSNKYQDKNVPFSETDEKPLVLSTIHSAKGLEWHTVFLPFALDGIMPSVRSMDTIENLEEERRLFYVACSRAKQNLFISMPSYVPSWDTVFTKPSRFLKEIDSSHYEISS